MKLFVNSVSDFVILTGFVAEGANISKLWNKDVIPLKWRYPEWWLRGLFRHIKRKLGFNKWHHITID